MNERLDEKLLDEGHKVLFDQFGYNFWYVADLYDRYKKDSNSVSEYWQNYFSDISEAAESVEKTPQNGQKSGEIREIIDRIEKPKSLNQTQFTDTEKPQKITGVGAKIIDNMISSLSIPVATSQRAISVKLLEENRRIINQFLKKTNQGKISFTHIVAFAIVKALKSYPAINNSFSMINNDPYLIQKSDVNLGIAVDIEKKDGTRSLIVPNIKKADRIDFSEFFKLYDDIISRSRTGK
ncbi:MAG: 2-oxo acid dehydrogenase subunit E2, partial [Bacteroidota bacterium]|nr:2-oxo acid dehydrogenase subunit E2 [Bacteroidota bacterium]